MASHLTSDLKGNFAGSSSPLAIVGACLFWLWMDAGIFSPTFCPGLVDSQCYAAMFLATTLASVAALAVVAAKPFKGASLLDFGLKPVYSIGFVGMAGGLLALAADHIGSVPLAAFAGLVLGVAMTAFIQLWGWVCVAQGHHKALVHITAAWALALPFNVALALLPPSVSAVSVAVLLPASSALFAVLHRSQADPTLRIEMATSEKVRVFDTDELVFGFDRRLVLLIVAFCSIFGFMYATNVLPASSVQTTVTQVVGVRGITALLFCVASLTVLKDRVQSLFRTCFYVIIVGLFVMVAGLVAPDVYPASSWFVSVGYCGFDALVWTMVAFHGYVSPNAPSRNVAIAMLAEQAGILGGAAVGVAFSLAAIDMTARVLTLMALNMLAVVALVRYTEFGSRLWVMLVKASTETDEAFRPTDTMGTIARKYQLTERETEIASSFVNGRSMAHIAEKLFVSENTVKTHVRHVYAKLGIHGKQELIDLVEQWRDE